MSEAALWQHLRDGMGGGWLAQRHEDKLTAGIPDVSYSINRHGWIELKFLPSPPKRADSILRIDHFTVDQRNWLKNHGSRGGLCFVFLQVAKCYMLFDWTKVDQIGEVTYAEHRSLADGLWDKKIDWRQLGSLLVSPVKRKRITLYRE